MKTSGWPDEQGEAGRSQEDQEVPLIQECLLEVFSQAHGGRFPCSLSVSMLWSMLYRLHSIRFSLLSAQIA